MWAPLLYLRFTNASISITYSKGGMMEWHQFWKLLLQSLIFLVLIFGIGLEIVFERIKNYQKHKTNLEIRKMQAMNRNQRETDDLK
jgi:hypothetical protein